MTNPAPAPARVVHRAWYRYKVRGRFWLFLVIIAVVGIVVSAAWPRQALELDHPLVVSYETSPDGGRLTMQVNATEARVAVTADGRELRLEVSGASASRLAEIAAGDDFVRSYEVLPGGPDRFTLLVHLAAYGGHELAVSHEAVVCELLRPPLAGRRIVLDPGHGGRDPGCVSPSGLLEANLTLPVAQELRRLLQTSGASVRLTRDADTDFQQYSGRTMSSRERATVANDWRADVYVSIHFNSFTSARYSGTEVWHRGDNPDSRRLAILLMDELAGLGLNRRGVKVGDFAVLRDTKMPAVLVELGFLSNAVDEEFFTGPESLVRAAELMGRALEAYFR